MGDNIDFSALYKAASQFEQFRKNLTSDQEIAGAIQSFEFCYELSWKYMKRVLATKGVIVASPRDAFRSAAENALISNPEPWFDFLKKRNLTVHTYNQETAIEVTQVFETFSQELSQLITQFKQI